MGASPCNLADPRVRRTRALLQQSLYHLLETREFDSLSIQDITDAATLNRATFYDHYPDKFALLESLVASQLQQLLASRGVVFDGTSASALRATVLGVCDFMASAPGMQGDRPRQMAPHLESAVIAVVRGMILDGLRQHESERGVCPEMVANVAAWAIFGGAKQWAQTPGRRPSEKIVETVVRLVWPIFQAGAGH
jgi:AcrR family transcriptional regulator